MSALTPTHVYLCRECRRYGSLPGCHECAAIMLARRNAILRHRELTLEPAEVCARRRQALTVTS
ncbi:hypothetical protein CLV28_0691 [Sediminihabitans luteus]|uniref:Uncharacterized protein n=1 Tax=Sediminihabitans luteus TaxID=1138585 RepID=A0A2M9CZV7_9CELL|nr:hypothetical protein CLV28_0691 [Sediminihabitans luteus]GII98366.1 hypothetical protein Slu03_07440 [Sediminihabitans luteus]